MQEPFDPKSRPRLRGGVRLAPADEGRWQLRWDFDEVSFLEGDACRELLPWLATRLDGAKSVVELLSSPDCPCAPQQLEEVLAALCERGLVFDAQKEAVDDPLSAATAIWSSAPQNASLILNKVHRAAINVVGRSQLADLLVDSLSLQGFDRTARSANLPICDIFMQQAQVAPIDHPFPVVVETDYTCSQLEEMNRQALERGIRWMVVGAWNRRLLVGPIFVPGETACYRCYRSRLDSHRQHLAAQQSLDRWLRSDAVPRTDSAASAPVIPAVTQLAAAWTALELFTYFGGARPPRTLGRVLVYDPASAQLSTERVLRLPWCPCCSPYTLRQPKGQCADSLPSDGTP